MFDSLEARRLLSASLSDHILTVIGTEGNDQISIELAGDTINVREGDVVTPFALAGIQGIQVNGLGGDDYIVVDLAITQQATLRGGLGADTLIGGGGGDHLHGGGGNDVLRGRTNDDQLNGGAGDDSVHGGEGNDWLRDNADNGADSLGGGGGSDTISFEDRTGDLVITLDDDLANDGETGEGNLIHGVENVRGGAGNDRIVGNSANNRLDGGDGNDTLLGRQGNDSLTGGEGDDSLRGQHGDDSLSGNAGADVMRGASGVDWVIYAETFTDETPRSAGVSVSLDDLANDGETDEGDNVAADVENLTGTAFDDYMVGNEADNYFVGQGGNDTLIGLWGNDTLIGDAILFDGMLGFAGNDVMYGGLGDDTFYAHDSANPGPDGGLADTVRGGEGTDEIVRYDSLDDIDGVEEGLLI